MTAVIKAKKDRFVKIKLHHSELRAVNFGEITQRFGCLDAYIVGEVVKANPAFNQPYHGKVQLIKLQDALSTEANARSKTDEFKFFLQGEDVIENCKSVDRGDVLLVEMPFIVPNSNSYSFIANDERSEVSIWVVRKTGAYKCLYSAQGRVPSEKEPSKAQKVAKSNPTQPARSLRKRPHDCDSTTDSDAPENHKTSLAKRSPERQSARIHRKQTTSPSHIPRSHQTPDSARAGSEEIRGDIDVSELVDIVRPLRRLARAVPSGGMSDKASKTSEEGQSSVSNQVGSRPPKPAPQGRKGKGFKLGPKVALSTPMEKSVLRNPVLLNTPEEYVQGFNTVGYSPSDAASDGKTLERIPAKSAPKEIVRDCVVLLKKFNDQPGTSSRNTGLEQEKPDISKYSRNGTGVERPKGQEESINHSDPWQMSEDNEDLSSSACSGPATPSGTLTPSKFKAKSKSATEGNLAGQDETSSVRTSSNAADDARISTTSSPVTPSGTLTPRLKAKSNPLPKANLTLQGKTTSVRHSQRTDNQALSQNNTDQTTPSGTFTPSKLKAASKPVSDRGLAGQNDGSSVRRSKRVAAKAQGSASNGPASPSGTLTPEKRKARSNPLPDENLVEQHHTASVLSATQSVSTRTVRLNRLIVAQTELQEDNAPDLGQDVQPQSVPAQSSSSSANEEPLSTTSRPQPAQQPAQSSGATPLEAQAEAPTVSTTTCGAAATKTTSAISQGASTSLQATTHSVSSPTNVTTQDGATSRQCTTATVRYTVPSGYTKLSDLSAGTVVNVYGVVKFFKSPWQSRGTDMCSVVVLSDPSSDSSLECVLFQAAENQLPQIKSVGDIVRLHRIKISMYKDRLQAKSSRGFAALVIGRSWTGPVRKEVALVSSNSFSFSDDDKRVMEELRDWCASKPDVFPQTLQETISQLKPSMYCHILCKVMGVAKHRDLDAVVLTITDGTTPQFAVHSFDETVYDIIEPVPATSPNPLVDVFVFGEHSATVRRLGITSGSLVLLHGAHVSTYVDQPGASLYDVVNPELEICLHRGQDYGRTITLVQPNSPEAVNLTDRLK
ncbi:mucin-5AC [Nematostella vectensis]|uniref:mucin-5AC n=1 Tax=Nematostella vectensis TaxID=45351 RepID=UPI0013904879|nr:mucin-5AC [Nematostella vectensis]